MGGGSTFPTSLQHPLRDNTPAKCTHCSAHETGSDLAPPRLKHRAGRISLKIKRKTTDIANLSPRRHRMHVPFQVDAARSLGSPKSSITALGASTCKRISPQTPSPMRSIFATNGPAERLPFSSGNSTPANGCSLASATGRHPMKSVGSPRMGPEGSPLVTWMQRDALRHS